MNFVRYFWDVLEPGTKLVEGWTMEAICLHLEHLTLGNIPNNRLLINVPPGFSKPVHIDEPVLTERGFVRLGDIAVGDRVLTHKGRFREVTAVHEQGVLPLVCVRTFNGRAVKSAADHPFLTPRGWVEAGKLTGNDYVGVPHLAEPFGDGSMSPYEARLLAYLVGDGNITHDSLSFTNADDETIKDFILCAKEVGFHADERPHPSPNMIARKVVLKSFDGKWGNNRGEPPVRTWLKSHGLYKCSSYTKFIPGSVFRSGPEAIANFIGAYWSCDGTVIIRHQGNKTTMKAQATTVSERLAKDVQRGLMALNITSRIRRKETTLESKKQPGGIYVSYDVLTSERNEVAKIAKLPGLVGRKRKLAEMAFADRFEQPIYEDAVLSVEPDGEGECRCLTVDEDASFTVGGLAVHNSLITNVFWPAWVWGPMNQPTKRFIAFSYASHLTVRDNRKFLMLLQSQKYQAMYGDRFTLGQQGAIEVSTDKLGKKFATSVGGVSTGERGDYVILDDPHNVAEGESEAVRTGTVTFFRESLSNRLNSLDESCVVVIMQRVHEADVSGEIISQNLGYDHLMIPMEYEPSRHCVTSIGWEDPRTEDGELAWPERFTTANLRQFKTLPYMWSGQYMQAPAPRGGGILKEEWWKPFLADKDVHGNDGRMPVCDYVVVSLDPAYTEKKENDPSGCVVLGVWYQDNDPNARFIVMDAWSKHLEIQGANDLVKRKPSEKLGEWTVRTRQHWGLVEWVAFTCERFRGASRDGNLKLLIEGKASGISVEQLMRKAYAGKGWSIQMIDPKGADKIARVYAIQDMFAEGMVYVPVYANAKDGQGRLYLDPNAPLQHRDWCSDLIWECSSFPKGVHDDRVDAISQALRHIRSIGMAVRRDEAELMRNELMQHRGKNAAPLYES